MKTNATNDEAQVVKDELRERRRLDALDVQREIVREREKDSDPFGDMSARIHSITFDHDEVPQSAVIVTGRGIVHAEWKEVAGEYLWFLTGSDEAKRLAAGVLARVERCLEPEVRCRCCGRECEDGSGMCDRCERNYGGR